jgi:hypothetical protein
MTSDENSLKDIVKFLDPTGEIDDNDIQDISSQLRFSEVLDLVSAIKAEEMDAGREILSAYDERFKKAGEEAPDLETQESAIQPIPSTTSSFPKIAPKNLPSTANNKNYDDENEVDQLLNDPNKQNDPNVKQIKSILQRMQQR